jgi:uncharacterized protein YbjQ (UPF0145 family)
VTDFTWFSVERLGRKISITFVPSDRYDPSRPMISRRTHMLVTTTNAIEGRRIVEYKGLVAGEAILGANLFRDLFASIRDIVGGRSGAYEKVLNDARQTAVGEMTDKAAALGANAVIGVDLDYETIGSNGSMLMVTAAGTAVRVE